MFPAPPAAGPLVVTGRDREAKALVLDVHYAGWHSQSVSAYVVRPAVGRASNRVIAWIGSAASNRDTWLPDAVGYAADGVTSLLIDPPFARADPTPLVTGTARDGAVYVQTVQDIRIGLDAVVETFDADSGREAVVGHSFGASVSAILAGVDHNLRACAILSGSATTTSWIMAFPSALPSDVALADYAQAMAAYSPIAYVRHSRPVQLFIANGSQDVNYPQSEVRAFQAAAQEPKTVRTYDADHDLNRQALADVRQWLLRTL